MHEDSYDTIVIGAGISGLGLASLLGQSGQEVLTLEKGREIGGRAHSFKQRGHTTNMGGPRAGLENGKVDGLFAALGKEPGERGFFDDVKTVYDGELISLPQLAFRGNVEEAGIMIKTALQILEQGDLARYDAMSAHEWVSGLVTSPEVMDVARFSAIVMSTLPRLEDISASTLFESIRITSTNPRIYLAAHGYGDFIRILAETSRECGGEVRGPRGGGRDRRRGRPRARRGVPRRPDPREAGDGRGLPGRHRVPDLGPLQDRRSEPVPARSSARRSRRLDRQDGHLRHHRGGERADLRGQVLRAHRWSPLRASDLGLHGQQRGAIALARRGAPVRGVLSMRHRAG